MINNTGERRMGQEEDMSDPDKGKDDSNVEIHGNEGWIEDYV